MKTVHVKLTEEHKKKLQGVLGIDVKAEFKYVLKVYRKPENKIPKEFWPMFTLTSRDGVEVAEIEDSVGEIKFDGANNRTLKLNSGSQRIQTLEAGIVELKNFLLENGEAVSFNCSKAELVVGEKTHDNATVRDLIRYLPVAVQVELQDAINERKTLTAEELAGLE